MTGYISNPTLTLTFLNSDIQHETTQTIGSEGIVNGSITITENLISNLKPASNTVSLSLMYGQTVIEDIIRTEGNIRAVLTDGGQTIFTGYLSTNYSWVVNSYGEDMFSITIEDVGTRLLDVPFIESGEHLFQTTVSNAVSTIAQKAGIELADDIPTILTEVICTVSENETCKEILTQLLYEIGYVYYFNEYGLLNLFKIDCSTIDNIPTVDSANLAISSNQSIRLEKDIRQYKNVRVTFQNYGTADNYLVYRDTTGQDDSHPYCFHELKSGEYFDGGENYTLSQGETRSDTLTEAVNASSETSIVGSNDIVAVTSVSATFEATSRDIEAEIETSGGKYIKVFAHNKGNASAYITRLDAYGSIIYVKDNNVIRTAGSDSDSASTLDEEMAWIHDETLASRHANLVAQYYRTAGARYQFVSLQDIEAGQVVKLEDDVHTGLSVNVLITGKTYTDVSKIIKYEAVGISVFNLDSDVIKTTFIRGDQPIKGENGITYYFDCSADVIKSPSPTSSPTTTSITIKPYRRVGYNSAELILCPITVEATSNYGERDESWITIISQATSSLTFQPSAQYNAYRVSMSVNDEIVAQKVLPFVYDGEQGQTVNISVNRDLVDYYADNVIVDNSVITITAHGSSTVQIFINGSDNPSATGDREAIYEITPSSYLNDNSQISIMAQSGTARAYAYIKKNTLIGNLTLTIDGEYFEYYADNVPHDSNAVINATVVAENYSAYPTLTLDGSKLSTPNQSSYTVPISVSELQDKESIKLQANVYSKNAFASIYKLTDKGTLTISSDKYSFQYYADNEPHNGTDIATIKIAQEGYSSMPDLYVGGVKTEYVQDYYNFYSSALKNVNSIVIEIRKGNDSNSIEILKAFDNGSVRLSVSTNTVYYYYDNVAISGDIGVDVVYSGLFYPPTVKMGDTVIQMMEGHGSIPISTFNDNDSITITAYSERLPYIKDEEIITKEKQPLNLSFYMSGGQFSYGANGEVEPSQIIVTNQTSGLSDNSVVTLTVGTEIVQWTENNTYIITPEMVTGRYLMVTISYDGEERSAIITNLYDGKLLRLSADSLFFVLDSNNQLVPDQSITLTVYSSGIDTSNITWTDNKGLSIPQGTTSYELTPTDTTPYTFTITDGELSDTITIGFIRDGKDGSSSGMYLGIAIENPTTRQDGSPLAEGDFYLNLSDPYQPAPYKYSNGQWHLVTQYDLDWGYIMTATAADVLRINPNILTTSSYYAYFQMMAVNNAVIDALETQNLVLKDGGSIESQSYQESGGLEGFKIDDQGIIANTGTWRGSFANGLSFIPPTQVKIDKDMTQKEAYKALRAVGITDGNYYQGSCYDSANDNLIIPHAPSLFVPEYSDDSLYHFLDLKITKEKLNTTSGEQEIAHSDLFGYILDVLTLKPGVWLIVKARVEKDNGYDRMFKDGLYVLTLDNLRKLLKANINELGPTSINDYLIEQTNFPDELDKGEVMYAWGTFDFIIYWNPQKGSVYLVDDSETLVNGKRAYSYSDRSQQFIATNMIKVNNADGTPIERMYFNRGLAGFYAYFRHTEEDGQEYIECSCNIVGEDYSNSFAIIRSTNFFNWTVVSNIVAANDLSSSLASIGLTATGVMDFIADGDDMIMSLFSIDSSSSPEMSFFTGRFDTVNKTISLLPSNEAIFKIDKNEYTEIAKKYSAPIHKLPFIRKGNKIYGTNGGLNLFSYDTTTKVYEDLTNLFSKMGISSTEASTPDMFYTGDMNPVLRVVVKSADTPDFKAIMQADPNLTLIGLNEYEDILYLVFLFNKTIPVLAEYNTATKDFKVNSYASVSSPWTSETMDCTPFKEDGFISYVVNGVVYFNGVDLDINPSTFHNYSREDIANIIQGTDVESNSLELTGDTSATIVGSIPIAQGSYYITIKYGGSTVANILKTSKANLEKCVKEKGALENYSSITQLNLSHIALGTSYCFSNDKLAIWIDDQYILFDSSSGDELSKGQIVIDGIPTGNQYVWLYCTGVGRGTVSYCDDKFQTIALDPAEKKQYHIESTDGINWTADLISENIEKYFIGGVDIGTNYLCLAIKSEEIAGSCPAEINLISKETKQAWRPVTTSPIDKVYPTTLPPILKQNNKYYWALDELYSFYRSSQSAQREYVFAKDETPIYAALKNEYTGASSINDFVISVLKEGNVIEYTLSRSNQEVIDKFVTGVNISGVGLPNMEIFKGGRISTYINLNANPNTVDFVGTNFTFNNFIKKTADEIINDLTAEVESTPLCRLTLASDISYETSKITDGSYDSTNNDNRPIAGVDSTFTVNNIPINDVSEVNVKEDDDKLEIRLLTFNYEIPDVDMPYFVSELIVPPGSFRSEMWSIPRSYYFSEIESVKPFISLNKDSDEKVGTTFYWNFPAQFTSSEEVEVRAPILADGTINSGSSIPIPDSYIDDLN